MEDTEFMVNDYHGRWAKSACRKYVKGIDYWLELIVQQDGRCAFSGVMLLFDSASGAPQKGGPGAHAICAAVDQWSPGSDDLGH